MERGKVDLEPRMLAFILPFSFQIARGAEEWLPTTWRSVSEVREASRGCVSMILPVTASKVATVILSDLE